MPGLKLPRSRKAAKPEMFIQELVEKSPVSSRSDRNKAASDEKATTLSEKF